jgi:translation initiation factor 3 subunit B
MPSYDDEDQRSPEPILNKTFDTVVVVDNLPVIKIERFERLCSVIRKIFGGYGKIIDDGMYMPVAGPDGKKKTAGYAFIEYETPEMATKAVQEGDNKKLDNKHKMRVNHFADFNKFAAVEEAYEDPGKEAFDSKTNLSSWLLDSRDQFVVRHGTDTEIYWNDPIKKAQQNGRVLKYGGEREKEQDRQWTELYVAWSTKGSYLATFHTRGVALWGGDNFEKLGRFSHDGVQVLDFSPQEGYLVTCNNQEQRSKDDPEYLIIWDVRSGKKKRAFAKGGPFVWSHDDKYFARVGKDVISVYETPSMGLVGKKSIKCPGVKEVQWSPDQNILSYWVPESGTGGNIPASVALIEIPSRKVLREKHLYNVEDIKMHWQEQGNYLAVKMARRKSKKTIINNFEIFRIKDKDIPVEVLETDNAVVAFAWEPSGRRFAMIHTDGPRSNVSLYTMGKKKMKLLKTLENRPANCLFWSPTGDYLVSAGLGALNGALEFVDMSNCESVATQEHFMTRDVEWDPSGRYCITSVTQPLVSQGFTRYTMENGYKVWTAQGQMLANVKIETCYQLLWRPRPKTLLTTEQIAGIKENLKKYWKEFEKEDDEIKLAQLSGKAKEKRMWKDEWKAYRNKMDQEYKDNAVMRAELRGGVMSDDDNDYEIVEHWDEVQISTETQIVGEK